MNCRANLCRASLWLVRVIFLLISVSGFNAVGQDAPNEADSSEKSLLSRYSDNGYALRKVIPIGDLSPGIAFEKGAISLVPDPLDRTGRPRYGYAKPYIVIYLINDTDEPIPGIIGELNKVHSQVKFGGYWFSRELMEVCCGTVSAPKDLPAHHALALGGISDQRGDIDGDIRYTFNIPNRNIISDPLRGRYMANELQVIMKGEFYESRLEKSIGEGLLDGQWNSAMPATNLEEFCAVLELYRHYQLSLRARAKIMDWLLERAEKRDATVDQSKAIVRIKALLTKPWLMANDGQALTNRCIAALEARPSNVYGTPEKCRACVWRFLADNSLSIPRMTISVNGIETDGNASIEKLVALAKVSLNSSDPEIASASADFLGSRGINERMFGTEALLQFLESGRPEMIRAGLAGLKARNRIRDAVPWLLDRMKNDDPNLTDYYRRFFSSPSEEVEDWERAVLFHSLEIDPLETLETISVYGIQHRLGRLPDEWVDALRGFLNEQLSAERKQWWADEAERVRWGQLNPDHLVNCQALSKGISLLDTLNDSTDVPLLNAFLEHPAANGYGSSDGRASLYFSARITAKECLQRRNIKVPASVVTQIDMEPIPAPRDRREDFKRYICTHEFAIMGVSLVVLVGACFSLRRMRAIGVVGPGRVDAEDVKTEF